MNNDIERLSSWIVQPPSFADVEQYPVGSLARTIAEMGNAAEALRLEILGALLPAMEEANATIFDLYMESIRRRYQVAWITVLLLLTLVIGMGQ